MSKLAIALAAALAFGAGGAAAQTSHIGGALYWTTFEGRANDGKMVCGVRTNFPALNSTFMVKWFGGNNFLTVQLMKQTWQIPRGASAPMTITFDGDRWNVVGKPGVEPNILEFYVPNDRVNAFTRAFTVGRIMRVEFDGGTEPAWVASLAGDTVAMNAMLKCISDARGSGGGPTQPFSAASPTQPFRPPAQSGAADVPVDKDGGAKAPKD